MLTTLCSNVVVAQSVQFPNVVTVGAVLSSTKHGEYFTQVVEEANTRVSKYNLPEGFKLNYTFIEMSDNPILTAKDVCESIISQKVYVVIASHAPHSELSPIAISFTCGFYKIPVIGISARESSFSDKVSLIKDLVLM